jgi:hypothetical protein
LATKLLRKIEQNKQHGIISCWLILKHITHKMLM